MGEALINNYVYFKTLGDITPVRPNTILDQVILLWLYNSIQFKHVIQGLSVTAFSVIQILSLFRNQVRMKDGAFLISDSQIYRFDCCCNYHG